MTTNTVTASERQHLRELAKIQQEYANLPIMKERQQLWYEHNALTGTRPMIVMEEDTFLGEVLPPLVCQSPAGQWLEHRLLKKILPHELFDDDKIVDDTFTVPVEIEVVRWGQDLKITVADEGLGYHIEPLLTDLEDGFSILSPSKLTYNQALTEQREALAEDIFGDILPTRRINERNMWRGSLAKDAVDIMGMENLLFAIMDAPDTFQELMHFLVEDMLQEFRWQEEQELVFYNNGNDYMGSGSFCFNKELMDTGQPATLAGTWGHLNSQETVGISPAMYEEFFFPHFNRLAREFGLLYYGCCEPVDVFWESIRQYPNLRKVSISPWCDEEKMADYLADSETIYSRKPSPNFIGIQKDFDEEAFRASIAKTHQLTKDSCRTEYIFRDIYNLHGNTDKLRRAVEITREVTEQ